MKVLASIVAVASVPAWAAQLRKVAVDVQAGYKVELDNFRNMQYSAPLSVGGQNIPVIYDTGSFEILVLSTLCARCKGGTAVIYDSAKSHSFSGSSIVTEHYFGSGHAVSLKGFDNIRMGGSSSPYTVDRMSFWQIKDHGIEVWGPNAHFSGIVGLGHPDYIPEGYGAEGSHDRTLLKALGVHRFGMCLQRSGWEPSGFMTVEPTIQPGLFSAIDVVGHVHWAVRMSTFRFPGLSSPDPCISGCGAILDSGTSLIAVPPSAMNMVRELEGMLGADCNNIGNLPVLRINLGGHWLELPPKAYVVQEGATYCSLGFMTIEKDSQVGPVFILGMPFLRYYYTVFDKASMKIHVAAATSNCQVGGAAGAFGFSNLTNLTGANATHFADASRTTTRVFAAEDYTPTRGNRSAARLPEWASSRNGTHLML